MQPRPVLLTRRTALALAFATTCSRRAWSLAPKGATLDEALHILNRLAFGATPDELARVIAIGTDAWIAEQLHPERITEDESLVKLLDVIATRQKSQADLVEIYQKARAGANSPESSSVSGASSTSSPPRKRRPALAVAIEGRHERLLRALRSRRQLQEVLVDFWFNHFNVFQGKGLNRVLMSSYEREVIRPHVFGNFRAMLGATAKHPAMLFYLDNWLSTRPMAPTSARSSSSSVASPQRGLNENYARELMELHTLGVDGGYSQHDVTELARILTGWTMLLPPGRKKGSVERYALRPDEPEGSVFFFDPTRHDGGRKTWLGYEVEPKGQSEGEFALDVLARHPSTARHIATKLARHFVSDSPPQDLVDQLAASFLGSGGELRTVTEVLIRHPAFLTSSRKKFKTPYQYVVSAVRACGIAVTNTRPLQSQLVRMGQPVFGCPTPDGWRDAQSTWMNPNAMSQRIAFAVGLASGGSPTDQDAAIDRIRDASVANDQTPHTVQAASAPTASADAGGSTVDPNRLFASLGSAVSQKTRSSVETAPPHMRAALILGSPEFMHR